MLRKNFASGNQIRLKFLVALGLSLTVGCGTVGSQLVPSPFSGVAPESIPVGEVSEESLSTNGPTDLVPANAVVPVGYEERVHEDMVSEQPAFQETSAYTDGLVAEDHSGSVAFAGQQYCADCGPAACACGAAAITCEVPATRQLRDAQEYIFDGGDQQPTVVVQKDWNAKGVDPTDTVIYYETLGGKVCVKPTNRVPIYAPRFGAVRQVTGAELAAKAIGTERVFAPVSPSRFEEHDLAGTVMQPLQPHGEQQVDLLDAYRDNNQGIPIAQVLPPMRFSDAVVPFENIDFFTTGIMRDEDVPALGRVLAAARTWFHPEALEVLIDGKEAALVVDSKRAQDVHVFEMPDRCAMRICKAASHNIANSGDRIRFTIRFDNVGPKPLGNAVILDSLSPRLEYIDGSQQCSVDAKFSSEPNEVGSSVLQWAVEQPLEPGEGGVISFDCLVR